MRVLCTACNHEHNNHHVLHHHLSEGHPRRGRFNPDAHCYNCGSVGKMRSKEALQRASDMTIDARALVAPEDAQALALRAQQAEVAAAEAAQVRANQDKATEESFFQGN